MSNEKSLKRATTTTNLQLEKPLITDYYDVNVFNRNMDKVDEAYSEIMLNVSGLKLKAEKVSIADVDNYFTSDNVEGALKELASELNGQRLRGINIYNKLEEKLGIEVI